ncbi:neutral zinc metallopeptidase [Solicola sp. PLA-1-18]|uniref:KPN_02809 family neutral zinc metallopeptidase n=1 Tax=Solicola sp. PLA-1-18 TaxID=3380532 RepID=UPI003B7E6094
MTFREGAELDTSQVTSGGGGRGGAIVGGGVGSILLLVLGLIFGGDVLGGAGGGGGLAFDPTTITQAGQSEGDLSGKAFDECRTGADANANDTCRVIGTVNSVQDYWSDALPADGNRQYREAQTVLYSGQTQSPCGTASNATGPFYCPSDERVYIDASFFDELTRTYGSDGGALAQMYVVAHEYGHHVQQILGVLGAAQQDRQGAESGSVRIELMADCLAGVWANHASSTRDADGEALLEPLTRRDVESALSAAAAVGDDRIQRASGGQVNPEAWTHGSAAQRQRWFTTGYESGTLQRCDTLNARDL